VAMELGEGEDGRALGGRSRLGREEEVGFEIWGMRRPFMEVSRGLAIVDILKRSMMINGEHWVVCGTLIIVQVWWSIWFIDVVLESKFVLGME
jgi:hypothetical protein